MGINVEKCAKSSRLRRNRCRSGNADRRGRGFAHLGDFIQDDDAPPPPRRAEGDLLPLMKGQAHGRHSIHHPRERCTLPAVPAWDGRQAHTLEEVGQEFNVTRERIRGSRLRRCASPPSSRSSSFATSGVNKVFKGRGKRSRGVYHSRRNRIITDLKHSRFARLWRKR